MSQKLVTKYKNMDISILNPVQQTEKRAFGSHLSILIIACYVKNCQKEWESLKYAFSIRIDLSDLRWLDTKKLKNLHSVTNFVLPFFGQISFNFLGDFSKLLIKLAQKFGPSKIFLQGTKSI